MLSRFFAHAKLVSSVHHSFNISTKFEKATDERSWWYLEKRYALINVSGMCVDEHACYRREETWNRGV